MEKIKKYYDKAINLLTMNSKLWYNERNMKKKVKNMNLLMKLLFVMHCISCKVFCSVGKENLSFKKYSYGSKYHPYYSIGCFNLMELKNKQQDTATIKNESRRREDILNSCATIKNGEVPKSFASRIYDDNNILSPQQANFAIENILFRIINRCLQEAQKLEAQKKAFEKSIKAQLQFNLKCDLEAQEAKRVEGKLLEDFNAKYYTNELSTQSINDFMYKDNILKKQYLEKYDEFVKANGASERNKNLVDQLGCELVQLLNTRLGNLRELVSHSLPEKSNNFLLDYQKNNPEIPIYIERKFL